RGISHRSPIKIEPSGSLAIRHLRIYPRALLSAEAESLWLFSRGSGGHESISEYYASDGVQ
ncbi:MAG: hypothetical protein V4507_00065, partial [Verrucomicrobiota bacterium]